MIYAQERAASPMIQTEKYFPYETRPRSTEAPD